MIRFLRSRSLRFNKFRACDCGYSAFPFAIIENRFFRFALRPLLLGAASRMIHVQRSLPRAGLLAHLECIAELFQPTRCEAAAI